MNDRIDQGQFLYPVKMTDHLCHNPWRYRTEPRGPWSAWMCGCPRSTSEPRAQGDA